AARRRRRPTRVLAGAERRLRPGGARPTAPAARRPARHVRRRRRRVRDAPQEPARCAGPLGGEPGGRRAAAACRRHRPRPPRGTALGHRLRPPRRDRTGGSVTAVTARAPAKINVHLGVGPLRPDGFHELSTVYLAVSLFDTVTARPGDGISLVLE